jgi:hypothetical protein
VKEDLIFVITFRLYTKFIEVEREHNCGKIQVSPALPDTMERGRGARVRQGRKHKISFECALAPFSVNGLIQPVQLIQELRSKAWKLPYNTAIALGLD